LPLAVIFLGINDCCDATDDDDLETGIENISFALHNLYTKIGARKFIIIDTPPIDRSPQGRRPQPCLNPRETP
jgi:hypothetical protein